jgi:hypothetical protein
MGLVSRSAELLGLHKDGQIIGLAPAETEERRRLWWQIQHIDLIMAVKNGSTPLTFTADWDTKLPLNIEEGDISSDSKTLPKERTGLTTFSYTLFACWVMNQQRKFRLRHQQSAVDRALLGPLTDDIIDELEAGLQTQFVQYCDPIKPADIILQISARALICVLRLRRMHEYRVTSENLDAGSHEKYLDLCMQELGYTIATYSQASLKPFCWLGETTFVWHARKLVRIRARAQVLAKFYAIVIAMLVDMPHLTDCSKIKAAWALLEDLYAAASFLKDFSEDKKRLRAAELLIAAWDACINKPGLENMTRPDFVAELEALVSDIEVNEVSAATGQRGTRVAEPVADDFPGVGESISGLLDFEFADIEWSYWQ